ncbi:MAG: ABC transporter ATPase [Croceitalea sp.]|nr:ABC transporter ATPase [Croceitalea sp.]MBT8237820.1 ABC transporter ATPase [Croceitalea sp.]NNC34610.1 ABC transporter ATPase [Croceitalea sp.]NNL09520.1 ABC transporter ATPase [Croceitalea sp.]NNM19202.1 ABC transporter ATPase [Croceitalea sp.]
MLVDFEVLPDNARIWIYQCSRSFSADELVEVKKSLEQFLSQWTAHGSNLQAGYQIRYNRFIVIGLDQQMASASGCSIDASVHFIQALEQKYKVDLLDKMNVSYKQGEYVAYKNLKDFKKMAKERAVSKNTIVFNNLVNTKLEYMEHWEVPASESWHAHFM